MLFVFFVGWMGRKVEGRGVHGFFRGAEAPLRLVHGRGEGWEEEMSAKFDTPSVEGLLGNEALKR